jgi:hypothetical protein
MTQNSTANISLTPAEAEALHRQVSAAIDYVETHSTQLTEDGNAVLAEVATTKKVLGKISTALENRSKIESAR